MKTLLLVGLVCAALVGCQTTTFQFDYRSSCGGDDDRSWGLAYDLPDDLLDFRAAADLSSDTNRAFPVESWFSLPSGELMLCRTEFAPLHSCNGEWWQFRRDGGEIVVTEQSWWTCVT